MQVFDFIISQLWFLLDTCMISCLARNNSTLIPVIFNLPNSVYSKVCRYLSEQQIQQFFSLCPSPIFPLRSKLLFFPFKLSLPYLPSSCFFYPWTQLRSQCFWAKVTANTTPAWHSEFRLQLARLPRGKCPPCHELLKDRL